MARYRCYFLGENGQLVGAETIARENDEDAVAAARAQLAARAYAVGFELRQGSHLVSSEEIKVS